MFDKILSTILLVFAVGVFLFMWKYGANEQLLDKPWGLAMLFAGLLAGLIQGARMAQRSADKEKGTQ
jgi:hypothetical protein